MAVVVDWLDACRDGNLQALIALYADDATLDCGCFGPQTLKGRAEIKDYWEPKLAEFTSASFKIIDLALDNDVVRLDYTSFDRNAWRMHFWFADSGLIQATRCGLLHEQRQSVH